MKSQDKLPDTLEEAHQEILMLRQKNAELEERLQRREEMLGLNSKNSSKPPSSDFTKAKPKLRKLKKPKGNDRKARQLWPEEKVSQTFVCPPPEACDCGGVVHIHGKPYVHQHFELPEIEPLVTHYHLQYGRCQQCHKNHQGELPKGEFSGGSELTLNRGLLLIDWLFSTSHIQPAHLILAPPDR